MQCILAVDGGNTKTIALVAALDGTVLGIGRGGCSDMYNAEPTDGAADSAAAALANAEHAVRLALHAAGVSPAEIAVGVFNMAGADWPEDIQFWREAMRERGMGREIIAQNDALGVLYAASPDATGVSIVAGTGVATGARARRACLAQQLLAGRGAGQQSFGPEAALRDLPLRAGHRPVDVVDGARARVPRRALGRSCVTPLQQPPTARPRQSGSPRADLAR